MDNIIYKESKESQFAHGYKSDAQRRWAHTESGIKVLGKEEIKMIDNKSRGKDLPEKKADFKPGSILGILSESYQPLMSRKNQLMEHETTQKLLHGIKGSPDKYKEFDKNISANVKNFLMNKSESIQGKQAEHLKKLVDEHSNNFDDLLAAHEKYNKSLLSKLTPERMEKAVNVAGILSKGIIPAGAALTGLGLLGVGKGVVGVGKAALTSDLAKIVGATTVAPTVIDKVSKGLGQTIFKDPEAFNTEPAKGYIKNKALQSILNRSKQASEGFIAIEDHPDYIDVSISAHDEMFKLPAIYKAAANYQHLQDTFGIPIETIDEIKELFGVGKPISLTKETMDSISSDVGNIINKKNYKNMLIGAGLGFAGNLGANILGNIHNELKSKEKKSNVGELHPDIIIGIQKAMEPKTPVAKVTHQLSELMEQHPHLAPFALGALTGIFGLDVVSNLAKHSRHTYQTLRGTINPYYQQGYQQQGYYY